MRRAVCFAEKAYDKALPRSRRPRRAAARAGLQIDGEQATRAAAVQEKDVFALVEIALLA